jgi:hypothetical protein
MIETRFQIYLQNYNSKKDEFKNVFSLSEDDQEISKINYSKDNTVFSYSWLFCFWVVSIIFIEKEYWRILFNIQ